MPRIVDHDQRRAELSESVWRIAARDGLRAVSVRSVAKEAGCSPSSLRHYFTTQDELLGFAAERVYAEARARIDAMDQTGPVREVVARLLEEVLPMDDRRRFEADVWFAFAARAPGEVKLQERRHEFDQLMRSAAKRAIATLADNGVLAVGHTKAVEVNRLHALIDGLALHGSTESGLLRPRQIRAVLKAHLADLTT